MDPIKEEASARLLWVLRQIYGEWIKEQLRLRPSLGMAVGEAIDKALKAGIRKDV